MLRPTLTLPPFCSLPKRISSDRASPISVITRRRRGRAPKSGSKPFLASHLRASLVRVMDTLRSASWAESSRISLSTIFSTILRSSWLKEMIPSRRLRNSGEKRFLMAFWPLPFYWLTKPMAWPLISRAPALVVMMITTLRKSALRPELSVRVEWSIT